MLATLWVRADVCNITHVTDVFVSYARPQETQAHRIAEALRSLGYGVWRDDALEPNQVYADVIEGHLRNAKAVVVVWCSAAIRSQWVRAEADLARNQNTLVQVSIDGAKPPLPFSQIHCTDLSGWDGNLHDGRWRRVTQAVAGLVADRSGEVLSREEEPAAAPSSEQLLAVLPFDNLSGDPENGYFSDGISEEILQSVAALPELRVVGRSSSFQFRGSEKSTQNVSKILNATHILDGSVRRQGARVRVAATLVECANHTTLWSGRFDRDLSDIFELQDEIAAAVAEGLSQVFVASAKKKKIDPAAYELFLQAKSLVGLPPTAARGLDLLGAVVTLAPDFADGWSHFALAKATQLRTVTDSTERARLQGEVERASQRALALDGGQGLSFVALGFLEPPGAYARREPLLEKALAAAPGDCEILKQVGDFRFGVGRVRESFELVDHARTIDPLNQATVLSYADRLADVGRPDESYRVLAAARRQWPEFAWLYFAPMLTAALNRDWPRFEAISREASDVGLQITNYVSRTADLLRAPPEVARPMVVAAANRQLERTGSIQLALASLAAKMGATDEIYEIIERASFSHLFAPMGREADTHVLPGVIFGPTSCELRADRRFVQLCDKLGLCDYWLQTGRWPDCAAELAPLYDFKGEVAALAKVMFVPFPAK